MGQVGIKTWADFEAKHLGLCRVDDVEDLDYWANNHDWLLVEVEKHEGQGDRRHYLTPIGTTPIFQLTTYNDTVYYCGMIG